MRKLLAIRLDEELLAEVDRERQGRALSRTRVVAEALRLWIERRRTEEAVRRHGEGYARAPVEPDEFGPLLGAQRWPK